MKIAYIGLGSNLGNREHYLLTALEYIEAKDEIAITKMSSIYESFPLGVIEQPMFLNMVIEIQTSFCAIDLLNFLQKVEMRCNRKRGIKWGPRTLDLDILLYNQENMNSERLVIPHPRMQERGFVLIPLYEINPTLVQMHFFNAYEKVKEQHIRIWKHKSDIRIPVRKVGETNV